MIHGNKDIWWSCSYGILTTPQTCPSADRVNNTPKEHTRVDERGKATIKTGYVAMHKRESSNAQCKQAQIAQIMTAEDIYKQPAERKLVSCG